MNRNEVNLVALSEQVIIKHHSMIIHYGLESFNAHRFMIEILEIYNSTHNNSIKYDIQLLFKKYKYFSVIFALETPMCYYGVLGKLGVIQLVFDMFVKGEELNPTSIYSDFNRTFNIEDYFVSDSCSTSARIMTGTVYYTLKDLIYYSKSIDADPLKNAVFSRYYKVSSTLMDLNNTIFNNLTSYMVRYFILRHSDIGVTVKSFTANNSIDYFIEDILYRNINDDFGKMNGREILYSYLSPDIPMFDEHVVYRDFMEAIDRASLATLKYMTILYDLRDFIIYMMVITKYRNYKNSDIEYLDFVKGDDLIV